MRRFNCCVFNHPCPIFCPLLPRRCENTVVNPVITQSFGFFNNLSVGAVATNSIIPLSFVQGRGEGVLPSMTTGGAVTLLAGTYQITYLAGGTVPANGTISVKLRLNGADVAGSVLSSTLPAGQSTNLTQTIVLTVPQTSTLELVNNSAQATTYAYASLYVNAL